MSNLPMPSDLPRDQDQSAAGKSKSLPPPPEPPSVKLIVRLFLIPLLIAAAVIGIMIPFGLLTGGQGSLDSALADLRRPGGERTADYLVGPGAKQRYIDAKTIIDHLRQTKMSEAERIKLTSDVVDILDRYTRPNEGEVQHVLLLALGQIWMRPVDADSPQALASRKLALDTLLKFADAQEIPTRKAATLAIAYFKGRDEARAAIPILIKKLESDPDVDVKMAAAASLGQVANDSDADVIDVLGRAMRDTDPHDLELVWNAATALAQLNRPEAKDVVLRLLDRKELDQMQYYDRETDPKNPRMQPLSEFEKERILINAILACQNYTQPEVQAAIKRLSESDPSERVKQAALEVLAKKKG